MKPKKELTSEESWAMYAHARKELQAEINQKKVNIDRELFCKTAQEKMDLKTAKSKFKRFISK